MAQYSKTALSLGNSKTTALYFDYVIPLVVLVDFAKSLPDIELTATQYEKEECEYFNEFIEQKVLWLIPPYLRKDNAFMDQYAILGNLFIILGQKYLGAGEKGSNERPPHVPEKLFETIEETTIKHFKLFTRAYRLSKVPWDLGSWSADANDGDVADPMLSLTALNLIDVDKVPWKQIMEARRDSEAMDRLRRLRLFVYENYAGKNKAFIEDDIQKRIFDYELAVKKWGFETKEGIINVFLNSKILAGTSIGALTSALVGAPIAAVLALAGGTAVEIGRSSLIYRKQTLLLREIFMDNPVSYISHSKLKFDR